MLAGLLILIIAVFAWLLCTEGLWGATLIFFQTIFATLITLNWYEPLSGIVDENASFLGDYTDATVITILFCASLMALRTLTDLYIPNMVRFSRPVHIGGGALVGALTGWIVAGLSLVLMETLPLQKDFLGYDPNSAVLSEALAPDRKLLQFMTHCTRDVFDHDPAEVFDPNASFIRNYTDNRRVGTGGGSGGGSGGGGSNPDPEPDPGDVGDDAADAAADSIAL